MSSSAYDKNALSPSDWALYVSQCWIADQYVAVGMDGDKLASGGASSNSAARTRELVQALREVEHSLLLCWVRAMLSEHWFPMAERQAYRQLVQYNALKPMLAGGMDVSVSALLESEGVRQKESEEPMDTSLLAAPIAAQLQTVDRAWVIDKAAKLIDLLASTPAPALTSGKRRSSKTGPMRRQRTEEEDEDPYREDDAHPAHRVGYDDYSEPQYRERWRGYPNPIVFTDRAGAFHHPTQPAIRYGDGQYEYYWHGRPYRMDPFGPAAMMILRHRRGGGTRLSIYSHPELPLLERIRVPDDLFTVKVSSEGQSLTGQQAWERLPGFHDESVYESLYFDHRTADTMQHNVVEEAMDAWNDFAEQYNTERRDTLVPLLEDQRMPRDLGQIISDYDTEKQFPFQDRRMQTEEQRQMARADVPPRPAGTMGRADWHADDPDPTETRWALHEGAALERDVADHRRDLERVVRDARGIQQQHGAAAPRPVDNGVLIPVKLWMDDHSTPYLCVVSRSQDVWHRANGPAVVLTTPNAARAAGLDVPSDTSSWASRNAPFVDTGSKLEAWYTEGEMIRLNLDGPAHYRVYGSHESRLEGYPYRPNVQVRERIWIHPVLPLLSLTEELGGRARWSVFVNEGDMPTGDIYLDNDLDCWFSHDVSDLFLAWQQWDAAAPGLLPAHPTGGSVPRAISSRTAGSMAWAAVGSSSDVPVMTTVVREDGTQVRQWCDPGGALHHASEPAFVQRWETLDQQSRELSAHYTHGVAVRWAEPHAPSYVDRDVYDGDEGRVMRRCWAAVDLPCVVEERPDAEQPSCWSTLVVGSPQSTKLYRGPPRSYVVMDDTREQVYTTANLAVVRRAQRAWNQRCAPQGQVVFAQLVSTRTAAGKKRARGGDDDGDDDDGNDNEDKDDDDDELTSSIRGRSVVQPERRVKQRSYAKKSKDKEVDGYRDILRTILHSVDPDDDDDIDNLKGIKLMERIQAAARKLVKRERAAREQLVQVGRRAASILDDGSEMEAALALSSFPDNSDQDEKTPAPRRRQEPLAWTLSAQQPYSGSSSSSSSPAPRAPPPLASPAPSLAPVDRKSSFDLPAPVSPRAPILPPIQRSGTSQPINAAAPVPKTPPVNDYILDTLAKSAQRAPQRRKTPSPQVSGSEDQPTQEMETNPELSQLPDDLFGDSPVQVPVRSDSKLQDWSPVDEFGNPLRPSQAPSQTSAARGDNDDGGAMRLLKRSLDLPETATDDEALLLARDLMSRFGQDRSSGPTAGDVVSDVIGAVAQRARGSQGGALQPAKTAPKRPRYHLGFDLEDPGSYVNQRVVFGEREFGYDDRRWTTQTLRDPRRDDNPTITYRGYNNHHGTDPQHMYEERWHRDDDDFGPTSINYVPNYQGQRITTWRAKPALGLPTVAHSESTNPQWATWDSAGGSTEAETLQGLDQWNDAAKASSRPRERTAREAVLSSTGLDQDTAGLIAQYAGTPLPFPERARQRREEEEKATPPESTWARAHRRAIESDPDDSMRGHVSEVVNSVLVIARDLVPDTVTQLHAGFKRAIIVLAGQAVHTGHSITEKKSAPLAAIKETDTDDEKQPAQPNSPSTGSSSSSSSSGSSASSSSGSDSD